MAVWLTYADGSSLTRTTYFVYQEGEWSRSIRPVEPDRRDGGRPLPGHQRHAARRSMIKEWPRRWWHTPGPGPQKRGNTVDTIRIQQPHRAYHDRQDECLHACNYGWITLGQLVVDSSPVSESEEYALCLYLRL